MYSLVAGPAVAEGREQQLQGFMSNYKLVVSLTQSKGMHTSMVLIPSCRVFTTFECTVEVHEVGTPVPA